MTTPAALRPLAAWAIAVVVLYGLFVLAGGHDAIWSDRVDASWPVGAVVAVVIGLLAVDALLPIPSTAVLAASGAVLGAPLGAVANVVGLLAGFAVAMELGHRLRRSPAGAPDAPVGLGRSHAAAIAATRGVPVLNEAVAATAGHLGVDRRAASSAAVAGAVPVGIAYAVAADRLHIGLAGAVAVLAAIGAIQITVLLASRRRTVASSHIPDPPRRSTMSLKVRAGVFPTYGVHNPPEYSPCASPDCLYERKPGEPSDPLLPPYWTARWTMYRVFRGYEHVLPPYDGPPPGLVEGRDYEVSHGFTCYDSTWQGPDGQVGAMMEHYEHRSLPIFPMENHFSSSFISLGDDAYFITYDEDRPAGLEPICTFSDLNHPPARDFIKHLPYSSSDSARLDGCVQGYSFWTNPVATEPPIQVGAAPDRTHEHAILFGYAFDSEWTPDAVDPHAAPYRHPHSFYFSGYPDPPADAPIVSQHFDHFAMERPDPARTWDLVARLSGGAPPPACQLFGAGRRAARPTWEGHTQAGR